MTKRERKRKGKKPLPVPIEIPISSLREKGIPFEPGARAYQMGESFILVGRSKSAGWHISISHPTRYPTWDEIKHARYKLLPPGLTMAMYLPPEEQFVDLHPNCFHLFEIREGSRMVEVKDPRGRILGVERRTE